VPVGKNSKNRYLPPVDRTGGVGPGISRLSSGREVPEAPPEGLFANKKYFLFAKRPLRHPARPVGGMHPPAYFLLELIFYKLFKIHTFFKYKIYSPYSFVDIKKFSSILRRILRYLKLVLRWLSDNVLQRRIQILR
jgi:hypothetical protein